MIGDPGAGTQVCVAADDETHVLRTVTADGAVKTVWGRTGEKGFVDGPAEAARFDHPSFLAAQPAGPDPARWAFTRTFVVADSGNHAIRVVQEDGTVSTLAGTGRPGPAENVDDPRQACFRDPQGVAMDHLDNVYVADAGNFVIRRIDPQGRVTTLAGNGQQGCADGIGAGASFTRLKGLALCAGVLYVVDGHSVRSVAMDGEVRTVLGKVDEPGFQVLLEDNDVAAGNPCLRDPWSIICWDNMMYLTDGGNHAVRRLWVQPQGQGIALHTLAGDPAARGIRWGLLRDNLPRLLPPA